MTVIVVPNMQPAVDAVAQRTAACKAFMSGYVNDFATREQMRHYADCVAWLYPVPDDIRTLWIKAVILCAFAGFALGIWVAKKAGMYDSLLGWIGFGGFIGAMFGAIVPVVIACFWYGAKYLVS